MIKSDFQKKLDLKNCIYHSELESVLKLKNIPDGISGHISEWDFFWYSKVNMWAFEKSA